MANPVVSLLIVAKDQASRVISGVRGAVREFVAGAKEGAAEFGGFGQAFSSIADRGKAAFASLRASVNGIGEQLKNEIGPLGQLFTLGGVVAGLKKLNDAANELDGSIRRLQGAANLVGAPLDFVQDVARRGRDEFSLDAVEANNYAAELVTLAAKTGDLSKAQQALGDFLNLGAAQGLSTSETLQLLEQAADGSEKAVKKLFNLKPDEVFDAYAASIGKTKDELTEAERATAILTTATQKAATVGGAYADFVASAAGKQDDLGDALKDTAATIGQQLQPAFNLVIQVAGLALKVVQGVVVAAEALGATLGGIALTAGAVGSAIASALTGDFSEIKNIGATVKNVWTGVGDSVQESVDKAAGATQQVAGFDQQALDAANRQLQTEIKKREALEAGAEAARKAAEQAQKAAEAAERERQALEAANLARQRQERIDAGGGGNRILPAGQGIPPEQQGNVPGFLQGLGGIAGDRATQRANAQRAQGGGDVVATIAQTKTITEELAAVLNDAAAGPLQDFIAEGLKGFSDLGEAAKAFGRAVVQSLANIAAQLAASAILRAIFPSIPGVGAVKAATGGLVSGPGGPTSDDVPAMLSDGEFVVRAAAVKAVGADYLHYINSMGSTVRGASVRRFADGGLVGAAVERGAGAGGTTGVEVALEEGLVVRHIESPAGERAIVRVITNRRNAVNNSLQRGQATRR